MSQYDRKANNTTNYIHPNESNLWEVHKAMEYDERGYPMLRTLPGSNLIDAFGRMRVSEPHTIFDSTFRYSDDISNWDTALVNNGNISHNVSESSMILNVTGINTDEVIRETKRVFLYQPGKSQLILTSFVMNNAIDNLRQRIGLFDASNGFFLETENENIQIVKRSSSSGVLQETKILRENWNVDRLDGSGTSKINLDFSKGQILWIDLEWLGMGSVRLGFIVNGSFVTAHVFHHANIENKPYITTANLPIRCEIKNIGTNNISSNLKHICTAVISEGGQTPKVLTNSAITALTGLNMTTTVFRPLISIRLNSSKKDAVVIPTYSNIYGLQNTPFAYSIIEDATVIGGSWVTQTNSNVEYNVTATGITGGIILMQGIFMGGTSVQTKDIDFQNFNGSFQLRRKLNGVCETFVIAAKATTNNDDAVASLIWSEFK